VRLQKRTATAVETELANTEAELSALGESTLKANFQADLLKLATDEETVTRYLAGALQVHKRLHIAEVLNLQKQNEVHHSSYGRFHETPSLIQM